MKRHLLLWGLLLSLSFLSNPYAQSGILLNSPGATDGYTLLHSSPTAYLIDNCGDIVHQWSDIPSITYTVKLLPNGHLLYASGNAIYELDWDGELVDSMKITDPDLKLDYEQIRLPNGNYLSIARRSFSIQEFTELGYDLNGVSPSLIDVIIELNPQSKEIVWEWNIADHVIQERDANLPNYGVVADHPELVNMDAVSRFDWTGTESFMLNGMDYNATLDQIMFSVRKMSEIMIIDHSTTTEEAAGHEGGISGKGGDILYRWGNPANYNRGTAADRFLFFQHSPNWIQEGIHAGKISCYNNGLNRPNIAFEDRYSDIPVLSAPINLDENYTIENDEAFMPLIPEVVFSGQAIETRFYSSYLSGAVIMPNGNAFISVGSNGRIFELDEAGNVVWDYKKPTGSVFQADKYFPDYPAFMGRDLSPMGPLPQSSSDYECQLLTAYADQSMKDYPDFSIAYLTNQSIQITNSSGKGFSFQLINSVGQLISEGNISSNIHTIDRNTLSIGLYVLSLKEEGQKQQISKKIILP